MSKMLKIFWVILAAACVLIPTPTAAGTIALPNDISWVMTSATYLATVQQAYLNGINRLRVLAEGKESGTWCVVLGADETIISNVRFRAEQFAKGEGYTREAWNAWCKRKEASALPGAIDFLNEVRELGGRIIIITNRQEPLFKVTRDNLEKEGLPFDVLLLREGPYQDDVNKTQRRADVEKGTMKNLPLGARQPPLEILMLVGDQPHDLYQDKVFPEVRDRFGRDLIVIPNPMYGDGIGAAFEVPPEIAAARRAAAVREDPAVPAPPAAPEAPAPPPAPAVRSRITGTPITWQEAMKREGQTVTVEARIVGVYDPETRGQSGPVRLNTDRDFRNSLNIVFFKRDRSGVDQGFGDPQRFEGRTVRVRGRVGTFRDQMQLTVPNSDQIEIVY